MSFEQHFETKFNEMLGSLKGESDRAHVIIVASHLDVILEETLKLAFVPSPTSTDAVFDGPNALLVSFSNKIDICYRLGLISEFAARSLHLVRRIRNHFAHNISGCTFDDAETRSRTEELYKLHRIDVKHRQLAEVFGSSTKARFLMSAVLLIGVLSEVQHKLGSNRVREPEWPYSWLLEKS